MTANPTLPDRITKDIADAMRARDRVRLAPLRMLKAALMNREIEKGRPLDGPESLQVVSSLIKQRRDSIEQFQKGGRQDLAEKESREIALLESYLPPPLDTAAIERAVDEAIAETGATSAKDLGRVMKAVMPKLAG
ncbi:MAG: GatB/YqeY domain-containing protein, partial [Vicinamibacterales bacterium]